MIQYKLRRRHRVQNGLRTQRDSGGFKAERNTIQNGGDQYQQSAVALHDETLLFTLRLFFKHTLRRRRRHRNHHITDNLILIHRSLYRYYHSATSAMSIVLNTRNHHLDALCFVLRRNLPSEGLSNPFFPKILNVNSSERGWQRHSVQDM